MAKTKQQKPDAKAIAIDKWAPSAAAALLAATALVLLAAMNSPLLHKLEGMGIFLPTGMYLSECMARPAALVVWLSSCLNQFFFHPWLGAAIYGLCMAALMWLLAKAAGLRGGLAPLAGIPAAMALLGVLQLGYLVYNMKTTAPAYTPIVGMMAAAALAWGYRSLPAWWMRTIAAVAIVGIGYWLLGCYALLAALLCIIHEAATRRKLWWAPALAAALMAAAWPHLVYATHRLLLPEEHLYTIGFLRFYEPESHLLLPYRIAIAAMALLVAVGPWLSRRAAASKALAWASAFMLCAAVATTAACRNTDENLRVTLAMDHHMQQLQWEEALADARSLEGEPTRIVVLFTDLSLMRLGRAADEMFTYPIGSAMYQTTRGGSVMMDTGAKMLLMHFGRVNDAYRWCMEDKVEYGQKAEYLRYMAKCALLNSEWELARKYLGLLEKTWFHRDWARSHAKMLGRPDLVAADPELGPIVPLMQYANHLGSDNGKLEAYLMPMTAALNGGPDELLQLSMLCNLVQKDVDSFMPKLLRYSKTADRLPVHFQEAAIIYDHFNPGNDVASQLAIDQAVRDRFARFVEAYEKAAAGSEAAAKMRLQPQFGNTYWFYYFLNNGLQTM